MQLKRRILLRLEFDGREFCGWQLQSEAHENVKASIQGTVEKAIQMVLRLVDRVSVKGCGRTDAGVSAVEFFCHFDSPVEISDLEKFRHAVSCVLPDAISITAAYFVPDEFDSCEDVAKKLYDYRILLRRSKSALDFGRLWWIHGDSSSFNVEKLTSAAARFEGIHDFKAFAAANHQAATTIRHVEKVLVHVAPYFEDYLDSGLEIRLRFIAKGFLKQMVRNMVGALVEVAQHKRTESEISRLLESGAERKEAGYCAPAEGLCLVGVQYGRNF